MTGFENLLDVKLQVLDKRDGHLIAETSLAKTRWIMSGNMTLFNEHPLTMSVVSAGECSGYFNYQFGTRSVRSTNCADRIDGQRVVLGDRIQVGAGDYWFSLDLDDMHERAPQTAT